MKGHRKMLIWHRQIRGSRDGGEGWLISTTTKRGRVQSHPVLSSGHVHPFLETTDDYSLGGGIVTVSQRLYEGKASHD